ncbi:MAG: DUF5063 domain-containing protein [Bacteroidales bacterium]
MENTIPSEPAYSRNVLEMLAVANEYCLFVEKADEYTKEDLLGFFQKICPLLYIKGALLPIIDPANPEANERFVLEEKWEIIFNSLRMKFQPTDEFWFADDTFDKSPEMIKGSLAEHFADIYQDLKDFVILYQRNSLAAKENAVAECRRLFTNHWGIRIVNMLNALHFLNYPTIKENDNVF